MINIDNTKQEYKNGIFIGTNVDGRWYINDPRVSKRRVYRKTKFNNIFIRVRLFEKLVM